MFRLTRVTPPGAAYLSQSQDSTRMTGWEVEADRRYGKARIRLLRRP